MIAVRRIALAAATATLVAALPVPALAQAAKHAPTQQDLQAARAHFRDAEAAKARGDYQTAAVDYLAAYELFEDAEFFFDVAEVYRLAGDDQNALTYYEKYLELDPGGRGAAGARTAADAIRRAIAAKQDAAQRASDEAAAKERAAKEAAAKEAAAREAAAREAAAKDAAAKHGSTTEPATPDTSAPESPPADQPPAGRGLRIAGLASGAAGVVAIGVGVGFGLRARSIANEAAGWTTFQPDRYAQGKAAQRDLYVLTGVGAAALVAGGVLYYLGHQASERDDGGAITFAPSVDGSSITFTAAGRF